MVVPIQARTAHEIAKAHLAKLKLQGTKGDLVERAQAVAMVFRLAREERDSCSSLSNDISFAEAVTTR